MNSDTYEKLRNKICEAFDNIKKELVRSFEELNKKEEKDE